MENNKKERKNGTEKKKRNHYIWNYCHTISIRHKSRDGNHNSIWMSEWYNLIRRQHRLFFFFGCLVILVSLSTSFSLIRCCALFLQTFNLFLRVLIRPIYSSVQSKCNNANFLWQAINFECIHIQNVAKHPSFISYRNRKKSKR